MSDVLNNELKPNVYAAICPSRQVLALIGEKWVSLIIGALRNNTLRFGELKRVCEGVSQKMLTQTLRKLERDGLVIRTSYSNEMILRVEYQLTDLGKTLIVIVDTSKNWAEENLHQIEQNRVEFEQRQDSGE